MLNVRTHTSCVLTAEINKPFCNCLDMVMHTQVGGALLIHALHTTYAVQSLYFNISFNYIKTSLLSKHYDIINTKVLYAIRKQGKMTQGKSHVQHQQN